MLKWRNSPEIYKWCRQFEPISEFDHRAWYHSLHDRFDVKMYGVQHVDGTLVGVCGLTSIDYINRRAELSCYIGPEHQGLGFGSDAIELLLNHGFNRLGLNCIWGEAFADSPAIKLFRHLGFTEEGNRRQFYFREGEFVDAILFSILRDEYA